MLGFEMKYTLTSQYSRRIARRERGSRNHSQSQRDSRKDKGNTSPSPPPRKNDKSLEGGCNEDSLATADSLRGSYVLSIPVPYIEISTKDARRLTARGLLYLTQMDRFLNRGARR